MVQEHDYAARMAALAGSVAKAGLDAFVVTAQDSIYYLTGAAYKPLERLFFIIARPGGGPSLLVPRLEQEHMRKARGFDRVDSYWDYPSRPGEGWPEGLRGILGGASLVGIEPSTKAEIAAALDGLEIRTLPLVEELRLVKTEDEVAAIRSACGYADYGMSLMCSNLYKGVTPLEMFALARRIQARILADGNFDALANEILTAFWPAPSSAKPHGVPGLAERAGSGPLQNMSFLRVAGYAAECERTVFVERPTKDMRELYERVLEARRAAFAAIRPGASCAEIDDIANGYLRDKGLGAYLLHRTGHGIGLSNHEGPWLSSGSRDILAANMVISVEPAVYVPGIGGFRQSDTVLVTEGGCESLTRSPTAIDELVFTRARPLLELKGRAMRRMLRL